MNSNLTLHHFLKGSSIAGAGAVVGGLVDHLFRIVVARNLGPEQFGYFSLGLTVFTIAAVLASFSGHVGVAKFLSPLLQAKRYGEAKGVVNVALAVALVSSLFLTVTLFLLSDQIACVFFREPALSRVLQAFVGLLPLYAFQQFGQGCFRGMQSMLDVTLQRDFTDRMCRFLFFMLLLLWGWGMKGVLVSYYFGLSVSMIFAIYRLQRFFKPLFKAEDTVSQVQPYLRYAWPVTVADGLNIFRSTGEVLLLGVLASATDVGVYNASKVFLLFFQLPLLIFAPMFLPVLSKIFAQKNISEARKIYRAEARWFIIYGLSLVAAFFLFPGDIIELPFGKEFTGITSIVQILVIGAFVNLLTAHCGELLLSAGKSREVAVIKMASFLFAVVLGLLLMPRYGAVGAAVTLTLSQMFESVVQVSVIFREWRIQPFSKFHGRYVVFSLLSLGIVKAVLGVWPMDNRWGEVGVAIVAIIFIATVAPFLVGLHADDQEILRKIRGKLFGFCRG